MLRLLRHDHDEAGSATVEFALVTMLLVPMVIYTIYAGESIAAGIKAQEAEISAGWEVTAFRLHDYSGGGNRQGLINNAAAAAGNRVKDNLKDFNSFHDVNVDGYYGVFGHAQFQQVECVRRDNGDAGGGFGPSIHGTKYLKDDGWVGCQAKVQFENRKAVTQAHREWYHDKPKIIQDTFKKLTMCGLGKSYKGCDGGRGPRGFLVLTDDYGLEDPKPVQVGSEGPNNKFFNVGEDMYDGIANTSAWGMLNAATLFLIGMPDKGDTRDFKMGYMTTVDQTRHFSNDGGGMSLHLSPYHEEASEATKQTANLSQKSYGRRTHNYLAVQDPDWNKQ